MTFIHGPAIPGAVWSEISSEFFFAVVFFLLFSFVVVVALLCASPGQGDSGALTYDVYGISYVVMFRLNGRSTLSRKISELANSSLANNTPLCARPARSSPFLELFCNGEHVTLHHFLLIIIFHIVFWGWKEGKYVSHRKFIRYIIEKSRSLTKNKSQKQNGRNWGFCEKCPFEKWPTSKMLWLVPFCQSAY